LGYGKWGLNNQQTGLDIVQVLLIDSPAFDPSEWYWLHAALKFAKEKSEKGIEKKSTENDARLTTRWTVVMNEQNYLVARNLRHFARPYSHSDAPPILLGHIVQVK